MVLREEDVGKDITTFQKVLQYARTSVNFVVIPSVYMLPSDMHLRIGKTQGYNNNILFAPASVHPGIQVGVNMAKQPETHPTKQVEKATSKEVFQKVSCSKMREAEKHVDNKAVLITTGVAVILAYIGGGVSWECPERFVYAF